MKKKITQVLVGLVALFIVGNKVEGQWSPIGNYPANGVNANVFNSGLGNLSFDASGNLFVTGYNYNNSGGYYVAKWDGNTWSELGGTNTFKFNAPIWNLLTEANGNIYVVGLFTNSSGKYYVAKWNGSNWSELGGTNTSSFNNYIRSLSTDVNGNLYAAGDFINSGGKQYVAKWNGSAWSELGGTNSSTFNNRIFSLSTSASGNLYASGDFTNDSGQNYVAKWNGSSWSEVGGTNTSTFTGYIKNLCTDISGNLYASGLFRNHVGNTYVAKWDGNNWTEVGGSGSSLSYNVIASVTNDANGNIYVAARLTNYKGKHYIAKWDGNKWSEVGGTNTSTFNDDIYSLAIDSSGNLYAAGNFTLPNVSYTTRYVAKYGSTTTPLTLTSFTAQATETNQIKTSWQTATEINTSHFIVEQSNDGKTFTAKGTVKAVGSGANSYAFNVPLFLNTPSGDGGGGGILFFRLKMVDKDGSFTYSKIVSVSLTTHHSPLITISPNPAKDYTTISLSNSVTKATILVYDIAGKAVIKQTVNTNENIVRLNTSNLVKGVYIIEVFTDKGSIKKKLIVSK